MVSHQYKCIFIHIPKCAGTSIEVALGHFDGHEGRGGQDHRTIRMIEKPLSLPKIISSRDNFLEFTRRLRKRMGTAENPNNNNTVTSEQYEDYFKFSFVRNPWARAYSWYKNVMRDEIHQSNMGIESDISFRAFLKIYAGRGMLMPQTYWLKNYSGEIKLDFIGRFENLENDFNKVCEILNINGISLPHRVKGSSENYRHYYDEDTREIIADIYAEEIELFNYTF